MEYEMELWHGCFHVAVLFLCMGNWKIIEIFQKSY